jgi:hypothetical protein
MKPSLSLLSALWTKKEKKNGSSDCSRSLAKKKKKGTALSTRKPLKNLRKKICKF